MGLPFDLCPQIGHKQVLGTCFVVLILSQCTYFFIHSTNNCSVPPAVVDNKADLDPAQAFNMPVVTDLWICLCEEMCKVPRERTLVEVRCSQMTFALSSKTG